MVRYKIIVEYLGTDFNGWQRQSSGKSVQSVLEDAIFKFTSENVHVYGSGRTDSGVHALGQVAHFDLTKEFDEQVVKNATNFHLRPHKISIVDCKIVQEDFHARFSAKRRTYIYKILNNNHPSVIYKDLYWNFYKRKLDNNLMQIAANLLIGHHDFSSFRAANCQAKSPMKTIDFIEISKEGDEILITITAKSFLYHMVRNIVGSLVDVGVGKITIQQFEEIFYSCDRNKSSPTAPACGLYFFNVEY